MKVFESKPDVIFFSNGKLSLIKKLHNTKQSLIEEIVKPKG